LKALPFKFDEIGYWSELKLEIVEKYGAAYTKAFAGNRLKKYYIDAFSGAGVHISKSTRERVDGSPARILKIKPPFDGYHLIDLNADKTEYLRSIFGNRKDVQIYTGDANECLIKKILPTIKYEKFTRALCLLDPYGLDLEWNVMRAAGRSKAVDMFLNFPVMDMNRNVIWKDPNKVPSGGIERMTRFWGDESWKQIAYAKSPQGNLFAPEMIKQGNETIVAAFRERLKTVAGFKFVSDPLPMRNTKKATVYYLILASPKEVAHKIINDIFARYQKPDAT